MNIKRGDLRDDNAAEDELNQLCKELLDDYDAGFFFAVIQVPLNFIGLGFCMAYACDCYKNCCGFSEK